jgi:hypothetical protein
LETDDQSWQPASGPTPEGLPRRANDWSVRGRVPIGTTPLTARLVSRERFTSANGRELLRWTVVAWLLPGLRHPVVASGVTGIAGRRFGDWHQAVSRLGFCRVRLEEHGGESAIELWIAELLPIMRLSSASLSEYVPLAEHADGVGGPPAPTSPLDLPIPPPLLLREHELPLAGALVEREGEGRDRPVVLTRIDRVEARLA